MNDISIKELMTTNMITVLPNTPLLDVAKLLGDQKFDGVPVVDVDSKLLGVINQYDLLSKGAALHLPTLNTVFKNLTMINKDNAKIEGDFKKAFDLTAQDVMNSEPLTFPLTAKFSDAIKLFTDHHRVNPVPVVDTTGHIVGLVSRYDILRTYKKILLGE